MLALNIIAEQCHNHGSIQSKILLDGNQQILHLVCHRTGKELVCHDEFEVFDIISRKWRLSCEHFNGQFSRAILTTKRNLLEGVNILLRKLRFNNMDIKFWLPLPTGQVMEQVGNILYCQICLHNIMGIVRPHSLGRIYGTSVFCCHLKQFIKKQVKPGRGNGKTGLQEFSRHGITIRCQFYVRCSDILSGDNVFARYCRSRHHYAAMMPKGEGVQIAGGQEFCICFSSRISSFQFCHCGVKFR